MSTAMDTAAAKVETATVKVDTKPTKTDGSHITVTTTPLLDSETTEITSPTETEWKITIKGSDGATSEVVLSPVSAKNPARQEVNIYMPNAKAAEDADLEQAKAEEPAPPSTKYRWYTMTQQALTAILSTIIIAVEVLTLVRYRSTQDVAGAWPTNPLLSPTYVLLAMAVLSCTADIVTFGVNCCYGRVKSRAMSAVEKIRSVMGFLQAVATAIGAGYFKAAQSWSGAADLWGWTCSPAADAMQSVNSSGMLCNSNATAWALAILQTALHVLTVVMALWVLANPQGSFKDHSAEAAQVMADGQAKYSKIESDFGPPAAKS